MGLCLYISVCLFVRQMVCQLRAKERAIFAIQQNEGSLDAQKEVNLITFPSFYNNGMLRHSLATLEGSRILYFFLEPSYPENLPSLFIVGIFFSFCPFNRGRASLQAQGLARATVMSAHTRLKGKKRDKIPTKRVRGDSRDIS